MGPMFLSKNIGIGLESRLSKTILPKQEEHGSKYEISGISSSDTTTRRREFTMSQVMMEDHNGFGLI